MLPPSPPSASENARLSRRGPFFNPPNFRKFCTKKGAFALSESGKFCTIFPNRLGPDHSLRTSPSTTPPLDIRSLPVNRNASEIRSSPRSNFIAASIPSACSIISSNNISPGNCSLPTGQFQTPRPPRRSFSCSCSTHRRRASLRSTSSPLLWSHGKPVMGVPNENDFHARGRAMDTWDNDSDKLTLAWLQDGEVHGALTLRRPMSVDGGTWMKLLDHDVERINAIGDGWNQKTGHHRWDGLYDVDKEGNPLRPSVVTPTPFESKDAWNSNLTDPADVLKFLMARNKYAGAIGMASNYAANLDMAGAFDPDRHLFCLSEDVIDGNGIPENLLEHLRNEVYQTAKSGTAMCPCVWNRVAGEMGRLHRETTEDKFAHLPVSTKCPEHHGLYHNWSGQAVDYLENKLQLRQLCANGPLDRLTQEHDELLTAIVREAFAKRNAAWRKCVSEEEALRKEPGTPDFILDSLRAQAIEQAHRTELKAANEAFAKAQALPGYEYGDFTNVWFQLELNCRRRFKKGPLPAPITVMALSNLPQEEHLGFYASGPSVATAIVRTMEAPREARQKGVTPGATFRIAKDGSNWYWLCRPDGTKVTRIRADAKAYLKMRLEAVGFLPDFQAPECNQVQLPPDQDEGPSYTLALKILGA